MSTLDHLKAQTEKQRIPVVLPDRLPGEEDFDSGGAATVTPNAKAAAGNAQEEALAADLDPEADPRRARAGPSIEPISAAYYSYWIEQLEKAHAGSPEFAESFLNAALQNAPLGGWPSVDDQRVFGLAGGTLLPFQDVAHWLKLRAVVQAAMGRPVGGGVSPDIAQYWLRQLGPLERIEKESTAAWRDRCQHIGQAADRIGKGLPPALVVGLQAHPEWARAYLKCGSAKARLAQVDTRIPAGRRADAERESPIAPDPTDDRGQGAATPDPTASSPDPPPASPVIPSGNWPVAGLASGAGGVGGTLGALAGRWIGGTVAGWKAGFARAVSGAAPLGRSADGLREKRAAGPADTREWEIHTALAGAQQALTDFTQASQQLQGHPHLVAFWREVDQRAATRFQGDRAALFREMGGGSANPSHPLRGWLEKSLKADAHLALRYEEAYAAFDRLQAAWRHCAQVHQTAGRRWVPLTEQTTALRAACRQVPPGPDRPVLAEQAERLVRTLVEAIRQAFRRTRPTANGSTAAPAA